ncbi:MAG: hypothetical protein ACRDD7_11090 [Peptostreptococcaceae bacterium]
MENMINENMINENKVDTTTANICFIEDYVFERDSRFHWVNIFKMEGQNKIYVDQIEKDDSLIFDLEELLEVSKEWYTENVINKSNIAAEKFDEEKTLKEIEEIDYKLKVGELDMRVANIESTLEQVYGLVNMLGGVVEVLTKLQANRPIEQEK